MPTAYVNRVFQEGEGVKNWQNFAFVIYGCPQGFTDTVNSNGTWRWSHSNKKANFTAWFNDTISERKIYANNSAILWPLQSYLWAKTPISYNCFPICQFIP